MADTTTTKGRAMRSASALSRVATAAVAVLALGLTASPAIAASSSADAADRGTSATTATATETSTDTRSRFHKCVDLRCKVTVRRGDSFFASGRHVINEVEFPKISRNRIQVIASGNLRSWVCDSWGPRLKCLINNEIYVTIKNVRGHKATARFWRD